MLAAASQSPASVGSPCTPFAALRGSNVKAPADGDVATVAQLCLRGNSVGTLSRVPFSDKPGAPISEIDLARDASLHPLTAIGAPDGTAVDIRSRNGNWTHLFSGALWRAPAITASGEIQALDRGHGQFSVAASLGYFAVVLPRFLARVKGTIFDIDFEPSSAAFSVSEGTVAITRTVAIRLRDEHRSIDGIRFTDTITANGRSSVVYTLPLSVEREFQNQTEAERVLTQQLQMAIGTGDPQAIDDAIYNLQIVTGKTIVGFAGVAHGGSDGVAPLAASAPHGMSGTVLAGIVSAAALTGGTLLLTNTGHESVAAAQATGPPVAASPSPAATASPGASPSPSAPTPTPTASASKPTPTGTPTASPPVTATATPTATPTALPTATPTATPTASPSPVSGGVVISATHRPTAPPPALPRASHR